MKTADWGGYRPSVGEWRRRGARFFKGRFLFKGGKSTRAFCNKLI
jgi:hypothetical protein